MEDRRDRTPITVESNKTVDPAVMWLNDDDDDDDDDDGLMGVSDVDVVGR